MAYIKSEILEERKKWGDFSKKKIFCVNLKSFNLFLLEFIDILYIYLFDRNLNFAF